MCICTQKNRECAQHTIATLLAFLCIFDCPEYFLRCVPLKWVPFGKNGFLLGKMGSFWEKLVPFGKKPGKKDLVSQTKKLTTPRRNEKKKEKRKQMALSICTWSAGRLH